MKTITKIIENDRIPYYGQQLLHTPSLLFDIETTGFSPETTSLYLIGCLYLEKDHLTFRQFFAEDPSEEPALLTAFADLCGPFLSLASFNGLGFDVNYLRKKYLAYNLSDAILNKPHYDLFPLLSPLKNLLGLKNAKQKTLEAFLDTDRKDLYDGGKLINIYKKYCVAPSAGDLHDLLLHNEEDVLGILHLTKLLAYRHFLEGSYTLSSHQSHTYTDYRGNPAEELTLHLTPGVDFPKKVTLRIGGFYLFMEKDRAALNIPITEGNMRFFYPNYKDYWYFPEEKIAIHKNVATFAAKGNRIKATPETAHMLLGVEQFDQFDEDAKYHFIQNQLEHILMLVNQTS